MKLAMIVAMAENGVIGRDGDLPWHLSADLQRFKRLTMGHAILMGRRTWESLGRPLPGRTSIVISRQADYLSGHEDVLVVPGLEQAIAVAQHSDCAQDEVFVIGGAAIYEAALSQANRLLVTCVHAEVQGDVSFPEVDWEQWQLTASERHAADERNDHPYSFEEYRRVER